MATERKNYDNIECCEEHFYGRLVGTEPRARGYAPLSEDDAAFVRSQLAPSSISVEEILEQRKSMPLHNGTCRHCGKVIILEHDMDDYDCCHCNDSSSNPKDDSYDNLNGDDDEDSCDCGCSCDISKEELEQEKKDLEEQAKKLLERLGRIMACSGFVVPDIFRITVSWTLPIEEIITSHTKPMDYMLTVSIGKSQIILAGSKNQVLRDLTLVVKGAILVLSANLQLGE